MQREKPLTREPLLCCCKVRSGLNVIFAIMLIYGTILLVLGTYLVGSLIVIAGALGFCSTVVNRSLLVAIAAAGFTILMTFVCVASIVFLTQLTSYIQMRYSADVLGNAAIRQQSIKKIYNTWLAIYILSIILSLGFGLMVLNRMWAYHKFLKKINK
eukprot:NODE_339_length_10647_cov_0.388320.p6 type:complete len:157 gc:universal NODE_339_length_10647_cov_0.388320:3387-3857(+)